MDDELVSCSKANQQYNRKCEYAMYCGTRHENPVKTVQLYRQRARCNIVQCKTKSTNSGLQTAYCTKHKSRRAL